MTTFRFSSGTDRPSSKDHRAIAASGRGNRSTAAALVAGAAGVGAAAAYVGSHTYRLTTHTLELLEPGTFRRSKNRAEEFRILHLSDMHLLPNQVLKQEWLRRLAELKPDLVVNTGDNLGDSASVPAVAQALEPLMAFPGVFCFGNHDYEEPTPPGPFSFFTRNRDHSMPWKNLRAVFVEHGWEDCSNRKQEFVAGGIRLAIAGVDDPRTGRDDYSAIAGLPNRDADLSIGLTHSPEPHILNQFSDDNYQLLLAGHTHGGQICLPGGRPLVTNSGIDRSHASGLSRWNDAVLNVSVGLGCSKYTPVRMFCPPTAYLLRIVEKR